MDLELYGRILLAGGSIVLEPAPVFRYRRHEQSMTQLNSATMVRTVEETEVCRQLADEAKRLGWRRAAREGRLRVTVRLQALMRVAELRDARGPRFGPRATRSGCRSGGDGPETAEQVRPGRRADGSEQIEHADTVVELVGRLFIRRICP